MQNFLEKSLEKYPRKVLITATIVFVINLFIYLMTNEDNIGQLFACVMLGFTFALIGEAAWRLLKW